MKQIANRVELPLVEPLFESYHYQGIGSSIIKANPTIRNLYLNNSVSLVCTRKFLNGFTTPEITIKESDWYENPYLDKKWFSTQFIKGYIHYVIRELLNNGYYVAFNGVDDFYVKGKSFYRQRHFHHDGLICGYDQNDKTYCIYAYDDKWVYRKFWTPKKAFDKGIKSMCKNNVYSVICGLKAQSDNVEISVETIYQKLKHYLESDMEKYPFDGKGAVVGIVVHDYIQEYLKRLMNGSVPYERTDKRVFRVIWEHKKAMQERLFAVGSLIGIGDSYGKKYSAVVKEADTMRALYASYNIKQRSSLLSIVSNKLEKITSMEKEILRSFLNELEGEINNEALELLKKENE